MRYQRSAWADHYTHQIFETVLGATKKIRTFFLTVGVRCADLFRSTHCIQYYRIQYIIIYELFGYF